MSRVTLFLLFILALTTVQAWMTARNPISRKLSQSHHVSMSTVERPIETSQIVVPDTMDTFLGPLPDSIREMRSISDDNFDEETSSGLAVVLFSSSWCAPCQEMKRTITTQCMSKHSSKAKFFVVDTDYNAEAVATFNVRSIPSTLLFKDGALVSDIVGNVKEDVLNNQILKNFM